VEKTVRKLLVASQKSGVGKTTTSINLAAATAMAGGRVLLLEADPLSNISGGLGLAQHPQRQSLRRFGIDLPGAIVRDVIPGLDIISPYEEGACSDGELDDLLMVLSSPDAEEGYTCLLIDTPPFMGAKPGQLLGACEEFILVMRAEAMAYRTLPAFLEMVQRSRGTQEPIQMRGILLTLAEGEMAGGRYERELRGRFGNRVLPHAIPFDEEVARLMEQHQIVASAAPQLPASVEYHNLVASLKLAEQGHASGRGAAALLAAAASLQTVGVGSRGPSFSTNVVEAPPETAPVGAWSPDHAPTGEAPTFPAEKPSWLDDSHEAEQKAKAPLPSSPELPEMPELPELPPPVSPMRKSGSFPRPKSPAEQRSLAPIAPSASQTEHKSKIVPASGAKTKPADPASANPAQMAMILVGVAVVGGIALRFVQLPESTLPIAVGVAVTAGVILFLHLLMQSDKNSSSPPSLGGKGRASKDRTSVVIRSVGSKDSSVRLTNIVRRPPRPPSRRDT
jgi:chromosome partitioning protein